MPLWLLITLAVLAVNAAVVAFGARWHTVKPRATHTPDSPTASPEEGTHV